MFRTDFIAGNTVEKILSALLEHAYKNQTLA